MTPSMVQIRLAASAFFTGSRDRECSLSVPILPTCTSTMSCSVMDLSVVQKKLPGPVPSSTSIGGLHLCSVSKSGPLCH